MQLKPTKNYWRTALWAAIALLLVGSEGVIAVHLLMVGDWSGLLNPLIVLEMLFLLTLGIITVLLILLPFSIIRLEQVIRAAASDDSRLVVTASIQPDQQLALQPGERLILERRRTARSSARGIVQLLFVTVLIVVGGEFSFFSLLPAFNRSPLNLFAQFFVGSVTPPAPSPTAFDWFTAAFPLALGLFFLWGLASWWACSQRHLRWQGFGGDGACLRSSPMPPASQRKQKCQD